MIQTTTPSLSLRAPSLNSHKALHGSINWWSCTSCRHSLKREMSKLSAKWTVQKCYLIDAPTPHVSVQACIGMKYVVVVVVVTECVLLDSSPRTRALDDQLAPPGLRLPLQGGGGGRFHQCERRDCSSDDIRRDPAGFPLKVPLPLTNCKSSIRICVSEMDE